MAAVPTQINSDKVGIKRERSPTPDPDPVLAVSLKCGRCKSLVTNAHMSMCCDGMWCRDCFIGAHEENGGKCPGCRKKVSLDELKADVRAEKCAATTRVRCVYAEFGCKVTTTRDQAHSHTTNCPCKPLPIVVDELKGEVRNCKEELAKKDKELEIAKKNLQICEKAVDSSFRLLMEMLVHPRNLLEFVALDPILGPLWIVPVSAEQLFQTPPRCLINRLPVRDGCEAHLRFGLQQSRLYVQLVTECRGLAARSFCVKLLSPASWEWETIVQLADPPSQLEPIAMALRLSFGASPSSSWGVFREGIVVLEDIAQRYVVNDKIVVAVYMV